jgi:sugar lactone lactonase YvrE
MRVPVLATVCLAAILTACAAGERTTTGNWTGTIDTLANGAVHIQNPATGLWDESTAWHLEEELRIGIDDGVGPDLFGQITDIAVDDYGRIYILEGQAQEIRVFNADGTYLRTIGRQGGGPGEFQRAGALRWDPEGRLWVVDPGNARYSVFDTTGTYLTMARRTSGMQMLPWPGAIDADGNLTDVAMGQAATSASSLTLALVTYHFDGQDLTPMDTIRLPEYQAEYLEHRTENSFTRAGIPFAPYLAWRYDPSGFLLSGITDRYRFVRHALAGDTTQIIDLPYQPLPVSAEERAEAIERLEWFTNQGGKFDASRIPRTKPAFHNFFTDPDGYLWVMPTTTAAEKGHRFDIFDPDGRYLGPIVADFSSSSYSPLIIGDSFYTVTRDELEIPYLVRARIVGREVGASDARAD